jgi:GntR family transcriptional regulator
MLINPAHPAPVFTQIADGMRARVASGVYRPGDMVPSIRDLAVQLMVNPNTVKRAYDELEREGVLEARKGVGMFVRQATATPARTRALEVVRDAFASGVQQAKAAGIDRKSADACYAQAWSRQHEHKGGAL